MSATTRRLVFLLFAGLLVAFALCIVAVAASADDAAPTEENVVDAQETEIPAVIGEDQLTEEERITVGTKPPTAASSTEGAEAPTTKIVTEEDIAPGSEMPPTEAEGAQKESSSDEPSDVVSDDGELATTTSGDETTEAKEEVPPVPGDEDYVLGMDILFNQTDEASKGIAALEKASALGHPDAQSQLATMYAFGIGVEQNEAKAVLLHTFAAEAGNVASTLAMGYRSRYGIGLEKNNELAAEFYQKVASGVARDYSSQIHARIYQDDIETPEDDQSSVASTFFDLHTLRADKGNAQSCIVLAYAFMLGQHGVEQHGGHAASYFMKAIKLGERAGHGGLGQLYSQGIREGPSPIPIDVRKAIVHWELGAEKKDPISLNGLGFLHATGRYTGDGVADWAMSAKYFEQSAAQSNAEGLYNYGLLMLNGKIPGKDADVVNAKELLQRAANSGCVLAHYQLGLIKRRGYKLGKTIELIPRDAQQAVTHFIQVTRRGPFLRRMTHAHNEYTAGRYASALLHYLTLVESGVAMAKKNAAFLIRSQVGHNFEIIPAAHKTLSASAASASAAPKAESSSTNTVDGEAPIDQTAEDSASTTSNTPAPISDEEERNHALQTILFQLTWRSALEGSAEAHVRLGDHYSAGEGTERDDTKALQHYKAAADKGSAQGAFNLGLFHESGTGVKRDFFMAKRYFDMAEQHNDKAFLAVRVALVRMNFKWWWAHFFAGEQTTEVAATTTKDDASTTTDTDSPQSNSRIRVAPTSAVVQDPSTLSITSPERWWSAYSMICRVVDSLTPTVFGFALDTFFLFFGLALMSFLLLVRHNAFVL